MAFPSLGNLVCALSTALSQHYKIFTHLNAVWRKAGLSMEAYIHSLILMFTASPVPWLELSYISLWGGIRRNKD